jgi:hypothetical protein
VSPEEVYSRVLAWQASIARGRGSSTPRGRRMDLVPMVCPALDSIGDAEAIAAAVSTHNFSDTFNRAAGPLGANWDQDIPGACVIFPVNFAAFRGTDGVCTYSGWTAYTSATTTISLVQTAGTCGVVVQGQAIGSGQGYFIGYDQDAQTLTIWNDFFGGELASAAAGELPGTTPLVVVVTVAGGSSHIQATLGSTIISADDPTYLSGRVGFWNKTNTSDAYLDNFSVVG